MSDVVIKAGVYDIDIDDYHSQNPNVFPGPSISSGDMRKILAECPARFWAFSSLNPKRFVQKKKAALTFGIAAHALVLGEPEFDAKFILSPFAEFRSKEAREWRDAQKRQIVSEEDMAIIRDMAEAQRASPDAMNAFIEGEPEMSLVWQDEETGLWLKSRPDWLPHRPDQRLTTEYKTTVTLKPRHLNNAVFDYGYQMQAALMLDAIKIVKGILPVGIAFIMQEKEPPYLVEARLFTPEQIDFGRMQYRKAIRIIANCLKTGEWPGYKSEPTYFETPFWVSKAMENFNDDIGSGGEDPYTASDYLAAG